VISSLPVSMTTPQQMLALNRGHWGIENRLHWIRDTLLREDASTLRKGHAPEAVAMLRNLALTLLSKVNPSPTQAREICTRKPHIAIKQHAYLVDSPGY